MSAPGLDANQQVAVGLELAEAAGYKGMIGGQAADIGLAGPITNQSDLERLHRGKLRASNLLNVPDALLDAERVASRVVGTLAILAGTVLGVRRGESDLTWLLFEKTFREEDSSPRALQIKSKMSPGAPPTAP